MESLCVLVECKTEPHSEESSRDVSHHDGSNPPRQFEAVYVKSDIKREYDDFEAPASECPMTYRIKKEPEDLEETQNVDVVLNCSEAESEAPKTQDKVYACAICKYETRSALDLKEHLVIHVNAQPYACDHCDYKTSKKRELEEHSSTHTGIKPFQCALCNYKSGRKRNYKQHVKIHCKDYKKFRELGGWGNK